jgi:ribokinase
MKVLVVGDIVTDVLAVYSGLLATDSDTPARISQTAGGSAANTAAWLARAGSSVALVGVTGSDAAGAERIAELEAGGVDCASVRRADEAPTGTVIVLARDQHRTMLCDRGANHLLRPSDVDDTLDAHPRARHLHLSGYTLLDDSSRPAGRHALAAAARRGLTTSVDAASAAPLDRVGGPTFLEWIAGVDLLLANLDEARALRPDISTVDSKSTVDSLAGALLAVARIAVVKRGPDGAVWADRGGTLVHQPSVPADLIDSTGAGDAFAAALLTEWLSGGGPDQALVAGVRLGAQAVSQLGGRPRTR